LRASYIHKRNNTYHLRIRVPVDLQPVFGRREIHRSLRTTDLRTAKSVASTLLAEILAQFDAHRRQELPPEGFRSTGVGQGRETPALELRKRLLAANATEEPSTQSVSMAFALFEREKARAWRPKTLSMYRHALWLFLEIIGDKELHEVARADCRQYRDILMQLPPNMRKRWPGLSVEDVIVRQERPMDVKTVNKNVSFMGAFFSWAERESLIAKSPAKGLLLSLSQRPDLERRRFTSDELKLMFEEGSAHRERRDSSPSRYWIPLVALYTGMRLEEIAQLRTSDLRKVEEIDVIDTSKMRLKTKWSARTVPIHRKLLDLGFLEFCETKNEVFLWSDLNERRDGTRSDAYSKWFGRYRRRHGISERKVGFHSFRHTFIDEMKQI